MILIDSVPIFCEYYIHSVKLTAKVLENSATLEKEDILFLGAKTVGFREGFVMQRGHKPTDAAGTWTSWYQYRWPEAS